MLYIEGSLVLKDIIGRFRILSTEYRHGYSTVYSTRGGAIMSCFHTCSHYRGRFNLEHGPGKHLDGPLAEDALRHVDTGHVEWPAFWRNVPPWT